MNIFDHFNWVAKMQPLCSSRYLTLSAAAGLISVIVVILPHYEHQVDLKLNQQPFKNFRPGKIRLMVRKKL